MNKLSQYFNDRKLNELKRFFGDDVKVSDGKHETIRDFTHYISGDEILIVTNNIKMIKDNYVLLVDNNKAVYLKDFQILPVKNWEKGIDAYVVKLNRKYFRPYTFSFEFEGFHFEKEDTFDDLVRVAVDQDVEGLQWKIGHYGFEQED